MTNIKDALEQIRAACDEPLTYGRSNLADKVARIADQALSQLTVSPDREKVAACARKCANELVLLVEAATKVANRTGNTFVIDRQKVATMIAGHFAALLETRRK